MLEPTRVEHISSAPLWGRLLVLPTNIRIVLKGLPWTNTAAYYKHLKITAAKSFTTLDPEGRKKGNSHGS